MSHRSHHPIQQGIELALVIPVAVVGRLRKRLPDLTRQIADRRAVGKLAVGTVQARTTDAEPSSTEEPTASAHAPGDHDETDEASDVGSVVAPAAPSAIPDYASLAASQVVPRLAALSDVEIDEVAEYEKATRNRRTILAAVERRRS